MLTKCGQLGLYEMIENEIIDTLDLNLFSCKMKRICSEPTLNIHVNRFDKGTLAEEAVVIASNGQIVSLNTESETCIGKDLVHISTGKTIEGKISDILTESKKSIRKNVVVKINNSMKKEGKINTIGFDFLMVYDSYGIFVLSREMISEYLDESKDGVTATIPKYLVEKTFVRFPETDSIKPNKSYGEIKRKMMRDWLQDD